LILKLDPIFKEYYWGGVALKEMFSEQLLNYYEKSGMFSEIPRLAEVWAFACNMDGISRFSPAPKPKPSGDIMTLSLSSRSRINLFGSAYKGYSDFPFLVKFMDIAMNLPLQVNPDDEFAYINEHQKGRTEIWHILDCGEDSEIIFGFNKKISPEVFKKALSDNTVTELLRKIKVRKGDTFSIPPGTVYSIGKGITLVSIQESSTAFYTVYDYNRINEIGLPRQLQLDKALQVINYEPTEDYLPSAPLDGIVTLNQTEKYTSKILTVTNFHTITLRGDSFHNVLILDGIGNISDIDEMLPVKKGDSFFIPACDANYTLYGDMKVLITHI
jgi:mannose-6-phosphate isomerase